MTLQANFDNSYARLPDRFFTRQRPEPVEAPGLIAINRTLADRLGLFLPDAQDEIAAIFAGNHVPEGATPLAQVYAGHQFGGWVPQLGDGRAVLLGEVVAPDGARFDIQLKGSGRTPYSRMGDGRAWLGPVLREYIVSEAMAALGIPTTRALAAVTTGEPVLREAALPGAVLARVASSHIRVGTFQYFAARQDIDALQALADHAIARHYPDATGPEGLLDAVIGAQADLIARWMGVGFIHGVMNTDNMTISGETIDYGPCAFLDAYHPQAVFSSIDQYGRYAFGNQPQIAVWNLAQLATALLPLMPDRDAGIERFTEMVNGFSDRFETAWHAVLRAKLGLSTPQEGDLALAFDLLEAMARGEADFTNTFRALSGPDPDSAAALFRNPDTFAPWLARWQARLAQEGRDPATRQAAMQAVNPALIPRNHRIEQAIQAGVAGDFAPFERLANALATPYAPDAADLDLATPPQEAERVTRTFCGT
ncbi:Selenoprotein O and cysteine-containing-like protein [Roseibacterium elongatum DSM 19469]|uniref:Protein nucleotidyltransferase YdiU n=1 Tax=Roseicyclus elongatus DSM 19469 TaxID=1294273 RepID=W8SSJ9_9RHOB|nr:YdiU family protein [Roseibacterium elongatum]AHM05480.1 Selenoprotein O and cysteine-containing-like protein [Roseibacterium elongatum DSM 19469]